MSAVEKLYVARIGAVLFFVFLIAFTLAFYEDLSEMLFAECTAQLGSGLDALDASLAKN